MDVEEEIFFKEFFVIDNDCVCEIYLSSQFLLCVMFLWQSVKRFVVIIIVVFSRVSVLGQFLNIINLISKVVIRLEYWNGVIKVILFICIVIMEQIQVNVMIIVVVDKCQRFSVEIVIQGFVVLVNFVVLQIVVEEIMVFMIEGMVLDICCVVKFCMVIKVIVIRVYMDCCVKLFGSGCMINMML